MEILQWTGTDWNGPISGQEYMYNLFPDQNGPVIRPEWTWTDFKMG